jgi:benzoyl-CoA reductase/2-hydroxyglutaryl-CoA dehydratase subunit BcrC/BadD/HgdB
MSLEHPTAAQVADAARRLYYMAVNYAIDHPDVVSEAERAYWDPELWDIAERLGVLVGVEVTP